MGIKQLFGIPRSANRQPPAGQTNVDNGTSTISVLNATIGNFLNTLFFRTGGRVQDSRVLEQGLHLGWNDTGSNGASQLITKRGTGVGGFTFYNSNGSGTALSDQKTELFRITDSAVIVPDAMTFQRNCPVMARRRATGTLINNQTDTLVQFDSPETAYSNLTGLGITYNSPAAGNFQNTSGQTRTYMITYSLGFAHNTTGNQRISWIGLNGLNNDRRFAQCVMFPNLSFNQGTFVQGSCILRLSPNDYISLYVWHDAGNVGDTLGISGNFTGNSNNTRIQIALL